MIGLMEAWMDFLLGEWVVGWPGNCFGWLIGFMSDWVDNWWEGCVIGWMCVWMEIFVASMGDCVIV